MIAESRIDHRLPAARLLANLPWNQGADQTLGRDNNLSYDQVQNCSGGRIDREIRFHTPNSLVKLAINYHLSSKHLIQMRGNRLNLARNDQIQRWRSIEIIQSRQSDELKSSL